MNKYLYIPATLQATTGVLTVALQESIINQSSQRDGLGASRGRSTAKVQTRSCR